MQSAIVVADKEYPVICEVRLWTETGLEFRAGDGYNKRRRKQIDLCVWHWTGGERGAEDVFRTLQNKDYGVEFVVHRGIIWQFCDPILVDTADAGIVNARSCGVEIPNYGYRARGRPIPARGKKRATYMTSMRDRRQRFAHFSTNDIAAGLSLANALSSALPIPRQVPLLEGYEVLPRTMSADELQGFKGHLGHFHVSERKADPGYDLLEAMRACWAAEL